MILSNILTDTKVTCLSHSQSLEALANESMYLCLAVVYFFRSAIHFWKSVVFYHVIVRPMISVATRYTG